MKKPLNKFPYPWVMARRPHSTTLCLVHPLRAREI